MGRPFAPKRLSEDLTEMLDRFVADKNFAHLYMSYEWKNDTYDCGFPDIYDLEISVSGSANSNEVTLDNIKEVARWGRLCRKITIQNEDQFSSWNRTLSFFKASANSQEIQDLASNNTEGLANMLDIVIKGIGATHVSKVLRFAWPTQYGAIDSQLVRVVGNGDPDNSRQQWLQATAHLTDKGKKRWGIQPHKWTEHYGVWINILRYFAQKLNSSQELSVKCPHPRQFVDAGLRSGGIWTCADIEMALFAYASDVINGNR